jgi:hypothetical protein
MVSTRSFSELAELPWPTPPGLLPSPVALVPSVSSSERRNLWLFMVGSRVEDDLAMVSLGQFADWISWVNDFLSEVDML